MTRDLEPSADPPFWDDEDCPAALAVGAVTGFLFHLQDPVSDFMLPKRGFEREHGMLVAALKAFVRNSEDGKLGRVEAWDRIMQSGTNYFGKLNAAVGPRLVAIEAWHAAKAAALRPVRAKSRGAFDD